MRCAESVDAYVRNSQDAYVTGGCFAAFHAGSLFGVIVWGRPNQDDADLICAARGAELVDPGLHYVIMDYRLLEGVEAAAFNALAGFLNSHREVLGRVTARTALLVPNMAFAAATVSGFYNVVKSPYPSAVFTVVEEAEQYLGVPTLSPVAEVIEASAAGTSTTTKVRTLLEQRPGLGVDAVADALGLSARTLQRRLQDEGTTYVVEARKALVRRAMHLLSTSDAKVGDIAIAVGCSTPQHFSEVFRLETGVSPAAWRAHARRSGS